LSKRKPIKSPRGLAVLCAVEIEREGLLIPEAMARLTVRISDEDRKLAHELVYGTFRYLPGLTRVLAALCKTGKLPNHIRWLLLISVYQLRFTRIPDYAVLDQANKLALELGFPGLRRLVNGVLRNIQRKGDGLWSALSASEQLLPEWLAGLLAETYGEETLLGWTETWSERGCLSYWSLGGGALAEADEPSPDLPHAYRRWDTPDVEALTKGRAYIQNESSQAIAELACRLAPDSMIDLCAAPGGKCCYVAAFGKPSRLVAADIAGERLLLLEENRQRLGLDMEIARADARAVTEDAPFDLVLVDAPCSGIGIIGRHPEIKFLKPGPADEGVRNRQAEIAASGWQRVASGGYLLYGACSLDPAELPDPPEDAIPATDKLTEIGAGLPLVTAGDRFHIPPSEVMDGFVGALWRKP